MKSDTDFLNALEESQPYVKIVHNWLLSKEANAIIKPYEIRPNFEQRHEYADTGDIEIKQRVEVKGRKLSFTCAEDYPFDTVFVDAKYHIDRIPPSQLWGHIIVSEDGKYLCIIKSSTRHAWTAVERYDSKDGQNRDFYECPKHLCIFVKSVNNADPMD